MLAVCRNVGNNYNKGQFSKILLDSGRKSGFFRDKYRFAMIRYVRNRVNIRSTERKTFIDT
jgi:hypothetical protein